MLTAEIRKGNKNEGDKLVLTIDIDKNPAKSASGKTLVVATTHGNQATALQHDGKPIIVGVNAYVRA